MGCASSIETDPFIPQVLPEQVMRKLVPGMLVIARHVYEPEESVKQVNRAPCGTLFLDHIPLKDPLKWKSIRPVQLSGDWMYVVPNDPEAKLTTDPTYDETVGSMDVEPSESGTPEYPSPKLSGFDHPHAMVLDDDTLYIITCDTKTLQYNLEIYNKAMRRISIFPGLTSPRYVAANRRLLCIVDCTKDSSQYLLKIYDTNRVLVCEPYAIGRPINIIIGGERIFVVDRVHNKPGYRWTTLTILEQGILLKRVEMEYAEYQDVAMAKEYIYILSSWRPLIHKRYIRGNASAVKRVSTLPINDPWRIAASDDTLCVMDYDGGKYVLKIFAGNNTTIVPHEFNMPVRVLMFAGSVFVMDVAGDGYELKNFDLSGNILPINEKSRYLLNVTVGPGGIVCRHDYGGCSYKWLNDIVPKSYRFVNMNIVVFMGNNYVIDMNSHILAVYDDASHQIATPAGLTCPIRIIAGTDCLYVIDKIADNEQVIKVLFPGNDTFMSLQIPMHNVEYLAEIDDMLYVLNFDEQSTHWRIVYSHRPTNSAHDLEPQYISTDITNPVHFTASGNTLFIIDENEDIYSFVTLDTTTADNLAAYSIKRPILITASSTGGYVHVIECDNQKYQLISISCTDMRRKRLYFKGLANPISMAASGNLVYIIGQFDCEHRLIIVDYVEQIIVPHMYPLKDPYCVSCVDRHVYILDYDDRFVMKKYMVDDHATVMYAVHAPYPEEL